LIVQRGSRFFVRNDLKGGAAEYDFYYGDASDAGNVLVGDWTTPSVADISSTRDVTEYKRPVSGNGADQLAVRRGATYFQSVELEDARTDKSNPTAVRSVNYGNPTDSVFVAGLPSAVKTPVIIPETQVTDLFVDTTVYASGIAYDKDGVPLVTRYAINAGVTTKPYMSKNGGATPVQAYDRKGNVVTVAPNAYFSVDGTATGDYLFDTNVIATALPYVSLTDGGAALVAADYPANLVNGNYTGAPKNGTIVYNLKGAVITDTNIFWGDGMGVRRMP
jgi:hypothetical protein